jgi:hypothetical protein
VCTRHRLWHQQEHGHSENHAAGCGIRIVHEGASILSCLRDICVTIVTLRRITISQKQLHKWAIFLFGTT